MFNLGFTEMIILAGIALIVIGPKQLPEMARMLGRIINEFRRATTDFTSSIDEFKVKSRNYMADTEQLISAPPKKRAARSDDEEESLPKSEQLELPHQNEEQDFAQEPEIEAPQDGPAKEKGPKKS